MRNAKLFLIGMASVLLALGMMVVGCEEDSGSSGGTSYPPSGDANAFTSLAEALAYLDSQPTGGINASNPVLLKVNINLSNSTEGWHALVTELASRNKYVALDLSDSGVTDGEFNSGINGADKVMAKIVSLVLPDSATSIIGGSTALSSGIYASLKTVSGANITSIGAQAFYGCSALTTVYFPKATSIGTQAFANTGTTPLTITMGAVAPTVDSNIFSGVTGTKNVTVRGPSGATGYTSTWQSNFKGGNTYINLVIQYDGQSVPAPIDTEDAFTSLAFTLAYLNAHTDGNTVDNPVPLKLSINLSSATDGWDALVDVLLATGKYVALDLSACSMSGTTFDLYAGNVAGKNYIVSLVLPDSATSIASSSFDNSTYTSGSYSNNSYSKLGTVSGANVINIGDWDFCGCTALTEASFPDVTSIGDYAFHQCTALTPVSFPEATSIGSATFDGCTALATVSFSKVTSIRAGVFRGCKGLTSVSIPKATSIGGSAFSGTSLTTVSFPNVTGIGNWAFAGCTSLTTVSFPKATDIWGNAFQYCTSLTTVSFPEATSIGSYAFWNCTSMTSASFPEATSIEYSAFDACTALATLSIPKVTSIGEGAFANSDTAPLTITMGTASPTVGVDMFKDITGTKNVSIRVPNGATGYDTAWQNAFNGYGNNGNEHGTVNTYINLVVEYY